MENLTLLQKFKEDKNKTNAFINIFKYINEKYLGLGKELDEKIIIQLIELGDYCFENKSEKKSCKEEEFIYEIYQQLKIAYKNFENFEEDCINNLCELKGREVREIETLYEQISDICDNIIVQISFSDGLCYNKTFEKEFFEENMNVLKFKSYLAKALKSNAVILFDFYNDKIDELICTSIVFQNNEWYPLSPNYNKNFDKFAKKFHNVEYVMLKK